MKCAAAQQQPVCRLRARKGQPERQQAVSPPSVVEDEHTSPTVNCSLCTTQKNKVSNQTLLQLELKMNCVIKRGDSSAHVRGLEHDDSAAAFSTVRNSGSVIPRLLKPF